MPTNIDPLTGVPIESSSESGPAPLRAIAHGAVDIAAAGAKGAGYGFGDELIGFSQENREKYPLTYRMWQPFVAPIDLALRAPGAAVSALSAAGAEAYKQFGGSDADAQKLERDLNILGQGVMIETGMGGHHNAGKPVEPRPLSVADVLARVDASESPVVADFQRRALIASGMDEATVKAMTPADLQAVYRNSVAQGGFGPSARPPVEQPKAPSEPLARPTAEAEATTENALAPLPDASVPPENVRSQSSGARAALAAEPDDWVLPSPAQLWS